MKAQNLILPLLLLAAVAPGIVLAQASPAPPAPALAAPQGQGAAAARFQRHCERADRAGRRQRAAGRGQHHRRGHRAGILQRLRFLLSPLQPAKPHGAKHRVRPAHFRRRLHPDQRARGRPGRAGKIGQRHAHLGLEIPRHHRFRRRRGRSRPAQDRGQDGAVPLFRSQLHLAEPARRNGRRHGQPGRLSQLGQPGHSQRQEPQL